MNDRLTPIVRIVIFCPLLYLGVVISSNAARKLKLAYESRSWVRTGAYAYLSPSVEKIITYRGGEAIDTDYRRTINYTYYVEGKKYTGIYEESLEYLPYSTSEDAIEIEIYYDPENPTRSVRRAGEGFLLHMLGLTVGLVIIGGFLYGIAWNVRELWRER